ncbi:MAG: hypothetical protein IT242_08550 [Bacteroidia bacterium]|nr:hypothetical protein [Bacteroidia bacterium]
MKTRLLSTLLLFAVAILQSTHISGAEKKKIALKFQSVVQNELQRDLDTIGKDILLVKLDENGYENLIHENPDELLLDVAIDGSILVTLDLKRNDQFIRGMETGIIKDGVVSPVNYTPGAYYSGKVNNEFNSLSSFSFFPNDIMGFISRPHTGNMVIGKLNKNAGNLYVIYYENNLSKRNPYLCNSEKTAKPGQNFHESPESGAASSNCVRQYVECDYAMFLTNGSDIPAVMNYVTGLYNEVVTIYNNESVSFMVSAINVWSTPDPYTPNATSGDFLMAFKNYRTSYNGNIAHLLSTTSQNLGGVAWLDVLCNPSYSYAFSNIYNSFAGFPTFSWDVEVVTHEAGHNIGSNHTQWCGWPGGAIDNCYATEGGCTPGPAPVNGGTIMSYCHLAVYGINFINGFGPLPGDVLRDRVNNSPCLSACNCTPEVTISVTPGSFICTGTSVTFTAVSTLGGSNPVYQWKINNVNAGSNSPSFTSASLSDGDIVTCSMTSNESCAGGATVTSNAIIMSVNNAVTPTITIYVRANVICSGQNVIFTSNITDGGTAPIYQWKVNGINTGSNLPVYNTAALNDGDVVSCQLTSSLTCASPPTVMSNSIAMSVTTTVNPSIAISTPSGTVCNGSPVQFNSAVIYGGPSPIFDWKVNGIPVGVQTAYFITTSLVNGDLVQCDLTSSNTCANPASVTSNIISMVVNNGSVVPTNGLLAWYPFNGNTADHSGNGFDGVASGATLETDRFGHNNNSYSFNGARDHVQIGSPAGLNAVNSGLSVSAWVYLGANNSSQAAIVSKWKFNTVDDQYLLWLYNRSPNFAIGNSVNGASGVQSNITLNDSVWYHLVGIWDNSGLHKIYINGQLNNSVTFPVFNSINNSSLTDLRIGTEDSTYRAFRGKIDNVRIYNRTLSSQEVLVLYNEGVNASITINATTLSACQGDNITFTASSTGGGTSPVFTWKVNNVIVGANDSVFTSSTLSNNDSITCLLSSSDPCITPQVAISNSLHVSIIPPVVQSITISADQDSACVNDTITFTASPNNGSLTSQYTWKVNGIAVPGNNTTQLRTTTLNNNDIVLCEMTSAYPCISPPLAVSNSIQVTISNLQVPSVSISAFPNPVCSNDTMTLTPVPAWGGNSPLYEWYVNNVLSGTSSDTFFLTGGLSNSFIHCTMISSASCITTDSAISNTINAAVYVVNPPVITEMSDTLYSTPGLQYQWYVNASLITGASGSWIHPLSNGDYQVEVIDSNGCTSLSGIHSFTLGNNNPEAEASVRLFPNPATTAFTIVSGLNEDVLSELFSADGKKLFSHTIGTVHGPAIFTKSIEEFSEGIYFIRLTGKGFLPWVKPLIITKGQ